VGRWWQSLNQQNYYKSAGYATWYHQTFITSGHCVVDLPTANYRFGIFKHLLLVDIVLLIYPLLITALVSFYNSLI
jgi:hypothetical protein